MLEKITLGFIAENINDDELIYPAANNAYNLTLKAKQAFLLNNIYGVDINPYAVEVTKFSLLLKLLENENEGSVDNYLVKYKQKVLPSLDNNIKTGNSLVDEKYFQFNPEAIEDDELLFKVRPFNWINEFPFLQQIKGFDAIVGNPPYVRIQNMVKYIAEEIKYYQSKISSYSVAEIDTFDKYYLFIQRAINLLNQSGILGYIVPNKFFVVKGGKTLREFISSRSSLLKIVHFGVTQVFPNTSTYTAILILDKKEKKTFGFKRIKRIAPEFIAGAINYIPYNNDDYTDKPWIFVSKETEAIFNKVKAADITLLKNIAEIPVGLQTSADKIYIFQAHTETENTFKFSKGKIEYEIVHNISKLIWSVLSTKRGYAYDENNLQFTGGGNGPYYSLISDSSYSPLYILGILSHPVIEAMVKAGASEFQGAYYSHGKQFIENLPIKKIDFEKPEEKKQHNEIAKTVGQLIRTKAKFRQVYIGSKKNVLQRKLDYLYDQLINQINLLYKITGEEVKTVMNDEMFLTDLKED